MVVKLRFPASESFVCGQLANVANIVMRAYEDSASWLVEKGAKIAMTEIAGGRCTARTRKFLQGPHRGPP